MKRLTTFIAGAAVAATLGGCQQPAVSGWKSFSGDKNQTGYHPHAETAGQKY